MRFNGAIKFTFLIVIFLILSSPIVFSSIGYDTPKINRRVVPENIIEIGKEAIIEVSISNPSNHSLYVEYYEIIPNTFQITEVQGFKSSGSILMYSGELKPYGSFNGKYRIRVSSEGAFNLTGICSYYYDGLGGLEGTITIKDKIIIIKPINYKHSEQLVNLWILFREIFVWITLIIVVAIYSFAIVRLYRKKRVDTSVSIFAGIITLISLTGSFLIWMNDPTFFPFFLLFFILAVVYIILFMIAKFILG